MAANNNTTAMAKATVNSAGNITIGHYILGKTDTIFLIFLRQGSW